MILGCKKSDANQDSHYMSALVNGAQTTFSIGLFADSVSTSSYLSYIIIGQKTAAGDELLFDLLNYNKTVLVPGTYTGTNQLNLYVSYHTAGKEYKNLALDGFTVEITNVSNNSISGKFHGVVKVPLNQTDSITISNGQFYVPLLL